MADQILYSVSSRTEAVDQPFLKKDLIYVNDNSAGSTYNGQIIIETSAVANSGRWASYNEGFITIPYVVAFKPSVDLTAVVPNLQIGFKNGWWNIIHSVSVDYNSSNVVQLTPYINTYCSYRAITSWSQDDAIKYGGLCNFFKDTATSLSYCPAQAADALDGRGMCNNRIFPPVLTSVGNAQNTPLLMNSNYGTGSYND
ncbi:hypothetical protein EBU94_05775, partial [bacterium]|nr:hypothetical protein [bacterium]